MPSISAKTFCPLPDMEYCNERCGWWDEQGQCCALCSIAVSLRKISKR